MQVYVSWPRNYFLQKPLRLLLFVAPGGRPPRFLDSIGEGVARGCWRASIFENQILRCTSNCGECQRVGQSLVDVWQRAGENGRSVQCRLVQLLLDCTWQYEHHSCLGAKVPPWRTRNSWGGGMDSGTGGLLDSGWFDGLCLYLVISWRIRASRKWFSLIAFCPFSIKNQL